MISFHHVRQAATLDFDALQAQLRMAPMGRERMQPDPNKPPRDSAVLILVYPKRGTGLHLILTKRTDTLRGHSGQVSFPGGRCDDTDTSYEHTALRETCEEIGVCGNDIHVIGRLNTLWIPPSNYNVVPVLGIMQREPDIVPNPAEVAQVLHFPLRHLLNDDLKQTTQMTFREKDYDVPYYDVEGHIVWGATCMMLSELEHRLQAVLAS